jgi:acyl-CoA dehydrogenase
MSSPGVSVRAIVDMQGEHHFNEVVLDEVDIADDMVLGEVGDGWRQVTEQLALERGGAERYLSTYPLLSAMVRAVTHQPDRTAREQIGALVARLGALRRMAWMVAEDNDKGVAGTRSAAQLKYLGTTFEKEVVAAARYVLDVTGADASATALLRDAVLAVPSGSLRGGSSEVLLTLLARAGAGA